MANRNPYREEFFSEAGVLCATPDDTAAAGRAWAQWLDPGAVLSLEGPLGAGKTCFVRGLAAGLGIPAGAVSSPTFTLVHEYPAGRVPLVHYDLYRIEAGEDLEPLGLGDELGGSGICVLEWGDKFPAILPAGTVRLVFEIEGSARRLRARA